MARPASRQPDRCVEPIVVCDDGTFPNNRRPLLLYAGAAPAEASSIEDLFEGNDWPGAWRDGVYAYHHYHSSAHEALGVYCGSASLQFGGSNGPVREVRAGDVVVIPAGVAHKRLKASPDFAVVGAYPSGQRPDMCTGRPGERPGAERRIAALDEPAKDPVQGEGGALCRLWKA
ncbi:MAG: hypothetical protein JW820_08810 [Spirochaetales bacterium]|nr:hypothetical protein [Spirochaetales bacterium]